MGVVYRGKDPFIGRTVAIKTITGNFTDNPDLLERFYREARAAGALQHPNIVTIYDMGEDNGTPYIAMELLEGDDLAHLVDKEREEGGQNPLPASIKLNYMVQVCRALEYAHKRNIVHRDIKPGNIVVTHEGTVKVVDFGIARLTDTSSTSSGMLIGTIDYMSPEQIRGEKVDGRSDIWAVGVMMYEVLTYTKPFLGGNITAVMFAIVSQEPKGLRELRPDLPVEVEDIMRRIFKKEPGERYQSMEELLSELEPVARRMQQESVGQLVTQSETLLNSGELQRAKELLKQALVLDTSHLHAKTLLDRVNSEIRRSEVMPKLTGMVANAEKLFEAGNLEEARREADAALHLDSNFMPARELLGKVQEAEMQFKMVQTGMREARQHLAEGGLTEAEQSLDRILKAAPDNQEAQALRKQIAEEKERRGKRKQLTEGVQKARQLWTAQQYDEALKVLNTLEKEFPGESEVQKLLEAVRADQAQDEIQRSLAEARKLLGAQSFNEALSTLDNLLQRYPNESAAVKLRELVLQERTEHAKQLRLQKELESLKRQVNEEKFADAITNGEALLKEFPDDFELGRLVEFAKTQRSQQDVLKRKQARNQEINSLVQANNFDDALKACQEALKEFAGDAELKQRLEQVTAQQKEFKTRERQRLLDERLRTMRQAIERGDLTEAINLGQKTVSITGKDTDLTKLMEMAKQERTLRDQRRTHDEQTLKAIDLLESKKFDEAAKILRVLDRDDIIDPRVPALLRAAEDRRVPTREELALMRSKPVQGAESGEGDKTRVGGLGGLGKPAPVGAPAGDTGSATRVLRTGGSELEETIKSKTPLIPSQAPVATAPAAMNAAAVAPPAPVEEKTTVIPPVGETTVIAPPKTKEEKKKQKEKEREKERGKQAGEQEPAAAATTTVVTPPAPRVEPKPEVKPPVAPPPPPPPKPAVQPVAAAAAPPVREAPPKPAVEERKEPPKAPAYEAVPPPAKKGGMGMIIGGVVAAVVIGVGAYLVMKPASPEKEFQGKIDQIQLVVQQNIDAKNAQAAKDKLGELVNLESDPKFPGSLRASLDSLVSGDKDKIEKLSPIVQPPPPPPKGPSPEEKKANEMVAAAMKLAGKGDFDQGRKRLGEAEKFVKDQNLGPEFETRIKNDYTQIDTVQNDKEARDNLAKSNTLYDSATAAIANGQYDAAGQALDQLQGLGKGAAHQDEIAGLRTQIGTGRQEDQSFDQAKSLAQSSDANSLRSAKQTLSVLATRGGRHAKEAASLAETAQRNLDRLVAGEYKSKIDAAQSAVMQAIGAKDKGGAQSKLGELQAIGSDPNFPASLRGELAGLVNSDTSKIGSIVVQPEKPAAPTFVVSCTVMQQSHRDYTSPFKSGQQMAQMYLDKDLELKSGKDCGLPADDLKSGEWRLMVGIDTSGNVTDASLLTGDAGSGAKLAAAVKSNWHFTPPTLKGQPVQTRVAVIVRIN